MKTGALPFRWVEYSRDCPPIASRNSPTSHSAEMDRVWNITLVGYVRRNGLRVYSGQTVRDISHRKNFPWYTPRLHSKMLKIEDKESETWLKKT